MDSFEQEINQADLIIKYSFRAFLDKLIPAFVLCIYSVYSLLAVMESTKTIRIWHLFHSPKLAPIVFSAVIGILILLYKITSGKKNILFIAIAFFASIGLIANYIFFKNVVPREYIEFFLESVIGVSFLICLYLVVYINSSSITVNKRLMEIRTGVFQRKNNGTDLNNIEDPDLDRTFLDQILGLARLELKIKKEKQVLWIRHITAEDAEKLKTYLRAHTFSSAVEYWTTKDRVNGNVKNKNNRKNKVDNFIDDNNPADDNDDVE